MNNNIKGFEITHTLIHSVFQMMGAIVYGFGVYMLIERGYSASEAGVCFSLINLFSLLFVPIISNYLDNTDKITIFQVIILSSIMIVILYLINYFLDTKSLLLTIVFIFGNCLCCALEPLINSISPKLLSYGINIQFSSARAVGSLSYGVMCALFGFISSKTNYLSIILGGIIFSFGIFIISIILNRQFQTIKKNNALIEKDKEKLISFYEFLSNNISFLVLCIFLVGIFMGYTAADNFLLLVTENIGGTSKDMGYILAYKAILEGIAMFSFPSIIKRVKLETILFVTMLGFVLKQLFITIAPNVLFLYFAESFQMVSFSFIIPGMVEFVNKYLKKREVIRGVSMSILTISIGSTISSLITGFICDAYGVSFMNLFFLIITIVSAIGFSITLYYRNKSLIS